jgi:hypothetical protein
MKRAGIWLFLSLASCASVVDTPPYVVTRGAATPGATFCSELERDGRSVSTSNASWAWTFGIIAVGAGTAGAIVTTANAARDDEASIEAGVTGAALTAGSVALVPAVLALLSRSDAGSKLAEAANQAMIADNDRAAYDSCAAAKATWVGSRTDASAFASSLVRDLRRTQEELEEVEAERDRLKTKVEQEAADDEAAIGGRAGAGGAGGSPDAGEAGGG